MKNFLFLPQKFYSIAQQIAAAAITATGKITVEVRERGNGKLGVRSETEPRNVNQKQTANNAVTLIFTCPKPAKEQDQATNGSSRNH